MGDYFILNGRKIVAVTLEEWGRWFEHFPNRRVAEDRIGPVRISTVFLGLDHALGDRPQLFETMIFGGEHDEWQERCATYDEAEAMHARAVRLVKGGDE